MTNIDDLHDSTSMTTLAQAARPERAIDRNDAGKRLFPALVLGAFFLALLLALFSGATVYKNISDSTAKTNDARVGAGLVCNVIRANDAKGVVAVGEGPEGRSLVIRETLATGSYETRFYLYEGNVVQEYSLASNMYTPAKASVVTQSNTFDFTYSHGLLTVVTDQGTAEVSLRSAGGDSNA